MIFLIWPRRHGGSSLEDLTQVSHPRYAVQRVVVCQTHFRDRSLDFNEQVTLLNKYSAVAISSLPYAYFWKHRSLWNSSKTLYLRDGMRLSAFGQVKLYRSIRGAALHLLRSLHLLYTAKVSGILSQLQFIYLVWPPFYLYA